MIDLHTRLVPNSDLLATAVGDEAVMMDIDSGRYFTLNPVANEIWEGLGRGQALGEIADGLAARYDAAKAEIESEVLAFANLLVERKLAAVAQ